jgi:hypothetical protein
LPLAQLAPIIEYSHLDPLPSIGFPISLTSGSLRIHFSLGNSRKPFCSAEIAPGGLGTKLQAGISCGNALDSVS